MAQFKLKNGQTLTFRQACGDDAAACLEFLRIVGAETDYLLIGPDGLLGVTVEREAELLDAAHDSFWRRFYVGYVEGELACIANVEINANPRTRHNATMGISVRKKYWRQGIGSVCLEQIIRFCRSTGTVKNLCLSVFADNARAIRLYQKYGFLYEGCRKKYILVGNVYHDEALMRLPL